MSHYVGTVLYGESEIIFYFSEERKCAYSQP
jgi:hypothetical protein